MLRFSLSTLVLFFIFNNITSADWLFKPRLTGIGVYTDNLRLAPPGFEESDFVFELNPGFSLEGASSRLSATVNYNMQNLFYSNNSESNNTNHQLDARSTLEIWRDNFFLDVNGFINQAVINPQNTVGADTISLTDNLTDVYRFGISPYWVSDFGGYADFLARYDYGIVRYDEGANDSDIQIINLNLAGGRKFTALDWQLDYFNQTTDETGADPDQPLASGRSDRENLLGTVGYSFTEEFAINARAGYENNDVNDAISSENGSFWSLGFTWTPSRFISTTLFYGPDDKEIIVQLNPTSRTSFLVSRRDRSVGLDTGVVWEGTLEHRTRYSVWSASYTDSTVNGSVLLFDNQLVTCFSAIGNSIIANNLGLTPVLNSGLTLNSGDFRRKRFQSTVTYERARTNLSFDGYLEKRDFSLGDEEEGYGLGAAWSRNFGSNTMSMISTCWQHNEFNINQETDFWTTQIALTHGFTRDLTGALAYRFAQQNSSDSTFDYRENRIFLLLQLQF